MKKYILLGSAGVQFFTEEKWKALDDAVLQDNTADIVAWDSENDSFATLLDMIAGWENFIELSLEDLETIETNTNIEL